MTSRYRQTMSEAMEAVRLNELQSHTVRFLDPANGKRFAVPFKTHADAEKKMAQLKRDGVKDIKITMDTLKPGVTFKEQNNDDHEVSMARGELEATSDKALQLSSILKDKVESGNPIEAWVQSKITKAAEMIATVYDYMVYNPEMKEEFELDEAISSQQLQRLKDSWSDLKVMSPEKVKSLKNFLDKYSTDSLAQLSQANINFVSNMARSVMSKRKMGDPKHAGSMKEDAAADMQRVAKLRIQQMMIQKKVADMDKADPKNKTPLAIAKNDLDNIQMRMDQLKQRAERERTRPQVAAQNEPEKNKEQIQEKIEGLENKSDKSGIPYGILKQVYDRGMAAWKGGHRPGTTPQQWAFARVNSFITKGKTYHTADADLAKKARKN